MSVTIGVIGVPSSAGAYAPGQEQAPRALRRAGLVEKLKEAGRIVVDHGDSAVWRWRPDRGHPRAQNVDTVVNMATDTAARVRDVLAAGQRPLVLGGDCTIGLGVVAGHLPGDDRLGLLYFDLHPDLNTPSSVPDGAFDWMGLAHLLGEDGVAAELAQFGPRFPLLAPDQVLVFAYGPEQATPWEREVITRQGLYGIPVDEVRADRGGPHRPPPPRPSPGWSRAAIA
ncbi:MAG: arginase family protein [Chloroflexia bacterium]|nr:arginase family protein [Chloroflexia bacterium]